MRIDLGLVLALVFEFIIFIYYADTLFYRKRNKYVCYTIIAIGYALDLVICMFGNIFLNISAFIVLHFVMFIFCYHISIKSALFQSVLLEALGAATEFLIAYIPYIGIVPTESLTITPVQSLILTISSKLLYLIGIMLISRALCKDTKNVRLASIGLMTIPIITLIIIALLMKINIISSLLSVVCLMLMIVNIIVFAVNQRMVVTENEKAEIAAQQLKDKIDYDEYMMLKETNQQAAALNHDFKEHISALKSLIGSDNETAQEYIDSISKLTRPHFVEYSDNKILNVLLSKKKEECINKGIQFIIDPIKAHLTFLNDMDVVTIFSNLINNAIESCERSTEKMINLNIHIANENFVVIKIVNTSDTKPIVINSRLRTYKDNKKLHGIGMSSINRALNSYDGSLYWEYNELEKVFSTKIIIKYLTVQANI